MQEYKVTNPTPGLLLAALVLSGCPGSPSRTPTTSGEPLRRKKPP